MSDSAKDIVDIRLIKRESTELLRHFSLANEPEDLIRAAIKSICNYTRSIGGFYVACLEGNTDDDVVLSGAFGISQQFIDFEELKDSFPTRITVRQFRNRMASAGWKDVSLPGEIVASHQNFVGATLYCTPIRNTLGEITGYIGLENVSNSFLTSNLDGVLLLLTAIDTRLQIAEGSFNSQAAIVNKIIHDVNGGLSIIGLQNELLNLGIQNDSETQLVRNRIRTGLRKVDEAVMRLHEFSSIFFNQEQNSQAVSIKSVLNASLISVPIGTDLRSKIHVSTEGIGSECADLDVIVLYWLYRTIIATWINPTLWDPKDPVEMFIDLVYGPKENQCIDLVLSRDLHSSIDKGMKGVFDFNHGQTDSGLVTMSYAVALEYWVSIFGGSSIITESNGIRRVTVCIPLAS